MHSLEICVAKNFFLNIPGIFLKKYSINIISENIILCSCGEKIDKLLNDKIFPFNNYFNPHNFLF